MALLRDKIRKAIESGRSVLETNKRGAKPTIKWVLGPRPSPLRECSIKFQTLLDYICYCIPILSMVDPCARHAEPAAVQEFALFRIILPSLNLRAPSTVFVFPREQVEFFHSLFAVRHARKSFIFQQERHCCGHENLSSFVIKIVNYSN
jgi:hypothetical protein